MVIIFNQNGFLGQAPKKIITNLISLPNEAASALEQEFVLKDGLLVPNGSFKAPEIIFDERPLRLVTDFSSAPAKLRSEFNPIEKFEEQVNKTIASIAKPFDKSAAKLFFEHFSGIGDSMLLDREFIETSHFIANQNPAMQHTQNSVTRSLQEFSIKGAEKEIENLFSLLFKILHDYKLGKNLQLQCNAVKILYHGISYVKDFNWEKHITDFTNLLKHPNTLVSSLAEQALKLMHTKISTESFAEQILCNLEKRQRLAGDLAQLIFFKYPDLRNNFHNFDFTKIKAEEIIDNLDHYANIACNEVTMPQTSIGQVGIEVEMKLRGNDQKRSPDSPIQKSLVANDLNYLIKLGYDCNEKIAEVRTLDRGFKLNSVTHHDLLKTFALLQGDPDLVYFATNHINVDSIYGVGFCNSVFKYRNYCNHYWESIDNPPAVLTVDNQLAPFAYEVSILIDQIKLHDELNKIPAADFHKIRENFVKKLDDLDQNSRAKILLTLVEQIQKPELIPAILRLYAYKALPSLQNSRAALEPIDFATAKPYLENRNLLFADLYPMIHRLNEFSFTEAKDFLQNENNPRSIRSEVALKLQKLSFSEVKDFLENNNIAPEVRESVGSKLQELDFKELREFLENTKIPSRIRQLVARRLKELDFGEVKDFLEDQSIDPLVTKELAYRLRELDFKTIEKFLKDEKIDYRIQKAMASRLRKLDFNVLKNFLEDTNVVIDIRKAAATRLKELKFVEAEEFLKAQNIDFEIRNLVINKLENLKFAQIQDFLKDKNCDPHTSLSLLKQLQDLDFSEVEEFLQDESIRGELRGQVISRVASAKNQNTLISFLQNHSDLYPVDKRFLINLVA